MLNIFVFQCLYILDTSPLLALWFANIFSQSLVCLFIFITGSFTKVFNFDELQIIIVFLLWIMLLVLNLRALPSPES